MSPDRVVQTCRLLVTDRLAVVLLDQTHEALKRWYERNWQRHPTGPPDLRVLRDWLVEREIEVPPLYLATLVRWLRRTAPKRVRYPRAKDPYKTAWFYAGSMVTRASWFVALEQVAAHGCEYRRLLVAGDLKTASIARINRRIWARRAIEARANCRRTP